MVLEIHLWVEKLKAMADQGQIPDLTKGTNDV